MNTQAKISERGRALILAAAILDRPQADPDDDLAVLARQLTRAQEVIDALEKKVYVPGQWRCAKCSFRLTQSNLYALSGTVGPRDEPGDKCPNCNGPLWRVSAMDDRNEAFKCANDTFERFHAMREAAQRAYGALWREIVVTSPRIVAARKVLLAALTKEEQKAAVAMSVETFGSVSDQEAIAADMQAGVFPSRTMTAQPGTPHDPLS